MKPGTLEQYGLDCTLRRMLSGDGSQHRISLLSALLSLPKITSMPAHVFTAPACRTFIDVHDSRGIEWFNKERFEDLGEWLAGIGIIAGTTLPLSVAHATAAMVTAENELNYFRELAAHVGYRAGLYRRMLPDSPDKVLSLRE